MAERVVLVTGFEPFGEDEVNPSWEAAVALDGVVLDCATGPVTVLAVRVPVSWERGTATVLEAIRSLDPVAVVMTGLAAGRAAVTPERVFINVRNGKDNDGVELRESPVDPDGPAAYFSTLPFLDIVDALRAAGVPADVSNTAGTYLCNGVAYGVLHALAREGRRVPTGFIHVPATPEIVVRRQAKAAHEGRAVQPLPSLEQGTITRAVRLSVETALKAGPS